MRNNPDPAKAAQQSAEDTKKAQQTRNDLFARFGLPPTASIQALREKIDAEKAAAEAEIAASEQRIQARQVKK